MRPITYLSEQPADYVAALKVVSTLQELRSVVSDYAELAIDAVTIVAGMTEADFVEFQRGSKMERRGKFAGEAWSKRFAAILMPEPMFSVSAIADQYKVPFGCAYIRCKEVRPDILAKAGSR